MTEENGASNEGNPGGDPSGGEQTYSISDFRDTQWRESISDEAIRTHGNMANFNSIDDLAKSWKSAQDYISSEKLPMPNDDNPDSWGVVYDKLGRPSSTDGYEFGLPEGAPDAWSGEGFTKYQGDFKQKAHDAGLSKTQAESLWGFVQSKALDGYNTNVNANQATIDSMIEQSKQSFGADLMNSINQRDALLNKFGGQEAVEYVKSNPHLHNSPVMLKMFNEMAKNFKEDVMTDATVNRGSTLTPSEAKSKMNSILSDKNHPFNDRKHPGHNDAIQEFYKLGDMHKVGRD